jgi:hypothetical protein
VIDMKFVPDVLIESVCGILEGVDYPGHAELLRQDWPICEGAEQDELDKMFLRARKYDCFFMFDDDQLKQSLRYFLTGEKDK